MTFHNSLFQAPMILHPPLAWSQMGSGPATTENSRVPPPRGSNTDVDWTSVLSSQRIAHSLRADTCHRLLRSTSWARPMVIWNATFWMCGTGCFCILAPHESSCALVHAAVLDGPTWLSLEQIHGHWLCMYNISPPLQLIQLLVQCIYFGTMRSEMIESDIRKNTVVTDLHLHFFLREREREERETWKS